MKYYEGGNHSGNHYVMTAGVRCQGRQSFNSWSDGMNMPSLSLFNIIGLFRVNKQHLSIHFLTKQTFSDYKRNRMWMKVAQNYFKSVCSKCTKNGFQFSQIIKNSQLYIRSCVYVYANNYLFKAIVSAKILISSNISF